MGNWLEQIKNAIIGGSIAENPAVLIASGWRQDEKGNWIQQPSRQSKQLATNLKTIGEAGITAPTLSADIGLIIKGITHPINTAKILLRLYEMQDGFLSILEQLKYIMELDLQISQI